MLIALGEGTEKWCVLTAYGFDKELAKNKAGIYGTLESSENSQEMGVWYFGKFRQLTTNGCLQALRTTSPHGLL